MQRREKSFKSLIFVFFIIFLIWFLLQFLAPIALPKDSVTDLSGLVAISDNDEIIEEMDFPWNFIYSAGDGMCHQKAERSLFINGNQMPFCSRCTAIWIGFVVGLGFMLFFKLEIDIKFLIILIICIIPIGVDGVGQLLGFWESTHLIRIITGLLIGSVCGIAIGVIIDELTDMIKKRKKK